MVAATTIAHHSFASWVARAVGAEVRRDRVHLLGNDLSLEGDQPDLRSARTEINAETELARHERMADCLSIMSAMKNLMMASDSSLGPPATPP